MRPAFMRPGASNAATTGSSLPQRLGTRACKALVVAPTARHWLETLVVGAIAGGAAYALGRRTGLFRPRAGPRPTLAAALIVLATPALGEELLFRAALTPSRDEQRSDLAAILPSTVAFTLWHVATALTILPGARATFLRADFLAIAALEGAVCGWLRRRTGSVWPGVALHWAEVMVWKTWLGGPSLGALTSRP